MDMESMEISLRFANCLLITGFGTQTMIQRSPVLLSAIIVAATVLRANAWCTNPGSSSLMVIQQPRLLTHSYGARMDAAHKMLVNERSELQGHSNRRRFLKQKTMAAFLWTLPVNAVADERYVRTTKDFEYTFVPPNGLTASQKPLKTHLDEVNFANADYKFGITVDPVRIDSLAAFGTAEQVAAKVVLAEVNRDGVFDVTLMEDPIDKVSYYQLNYRSTGKRGVKRYVAKFYIRNNFLFALTAQCQEEAYETLKDDILKAVDSFEIVS